MKLKKQAINLPPLHNKSHRNNSSNKEVCVWLCACGCKRVWLSKRSKTSFPSCASLEIIEWTHSPNDPLQPHGRLVNSRSSMYDFTSHWDLFCVGILPFDINISMLSFNFSEIGNQWALSWFSFNRKVFVHQYYFHWKRKRVVVNIFSVIQK